MNSLWTSSQRELPMPNPEESTARGEKEGGHMRDQDEDEPEFDIELPDLPINSSGPPPECSFCGEPMSLIDGDWSCPDCNGELIGPETG
ncbi:MAG: hypothetical protein CO149_04240 [Nitrospirae bacterium CG_4_9_14_3_um_filter_51_5]|nr:MAG: hypothetical protein CO149_04240 [Nitrospirae bacterium CG_4_9_14_3_um_filter_51_5]